MAKKISFTIKNLRPVCRTPIKPVQKQKIATKYARRAKYHDKSYHQEIL